MAKVASVVITIPLGNTKAAAAVARYLHPTPDNIARGAEGLRDLLERVSSGLEDGTVYAYADNADGTAATGTIACTQSTIVDGATVKIAGVTFTAKTTPSTVPSKGEFAFLTSNTVTGAALAAAINAHPFLKGLLTAANGSGTVTLTLVDKGAFGNFLKMVGSTGLVITNPTNGAGGTEAGFLRVFRGSL